MTTNPTPVNAVPIAIEKREFYDAARAYAHYSDGTLFVYGEIHLIRNVLLPPNFYAQVKIFDTNGQTIAEIPAKLDRGEKHYRDDPLLNAKIEARAQVSLMQVKRIEVYFDKVE